MQHINRWMYREGKPNAIARWLNSLSISFYLRSSSPDFLNVLETIGRRSGNPIAMPIVVIHMRGERYLVSMLGNSTQWVKNVRASGGVAALLKGGRTEITLEEVSVAGRAPILKEYCRVAPAGRSHISVEKDAPVDDFDDIAEEYPVYRVVEV